MTMPATLSVMLDGLIDFAGLFPPAELEMTAMVSAYREAMLDERGWMVGRIIVPVSRLDEFEHAAADLLPDEEEADPWCVSALTRPCGDGGFGADLDAIAAFNTRHAEAACGRAVIDVIESRGDTAAAIDAAMDMIPDDIFPFIEISHKSDPRGLLAVLAGSEAAAKIRTGGVRPELYPSVDELAAFIAASASAGVPFKATAGLHHPLPNMNDVVPARQHGFLNVFLAAIMARSQELDAEAVRPLLEVCDPDAFVFGDDIARLGEYEIDRDEIEEARLSFAISFGACSVSDPWADLASLGLMEPESTETTT
jgi:hypothetical protein